MNHINHSFIWKLLLIVGFASGCIGDVDLAPQPPTLFPVESPTRKARQTLEGTKPAGTGVLNHGQVIVSHDEGEAWSYTLDLQPGENQVDLTSQKENGKESTEHTQALIVFEPDFPAQPSLDQVVSPTNQAGQQIGGTKPAQTSLELNGSEIVALDAETTWTHQLQLDEGEKVYDFSLVAIDASDKRSEPVDFEIELDQTPPAIVSKYPQGSDIPANALIFIAMDGPLAIAVDTVDPDIVVVKDSTDTKLSGVVIYNPLSYGLTTAVGLEADSSYTVSLDPTRFTDEAGNQAAVQPDWTWQFSTGPADDNTTPAVPVVELPTTVDPDSKHTTAREAALTGTKDSMTSVSINGLEVVTLNDSTAWAYTWALGVGENNLNVTARSVAGLESPPAMVQIFRDAVRPNPPTLDPAPPASVNDPLLVLLGTRQADTSVLYNGVVVVPRGPETNWVYNADLVPGVNEIELSARSADGMLSEPLLLVVDFVQEYEGPVEAGFKLMISLSLRDLARVDPIRTTFDTGSNHYSIDAWVEGPLEPGEVCQFDPIKKERQNIRYVGTITHYIGSKSGHTNPFWDPDYRAPNYLAALVTSGMFEHLGIGPEADRRDDNTGFQGGDLTDATGKIKLTTDDLGDVDGVTAATISSGAQVIEWLPLDRNLQRIQQGEYLIYILIGLDRDPNWVTSNDFETCWGDPVDNGRGQHRIVRRMGLGSVPYSVTIGQASEMAAPDQEHGVDQLRYITSEGVTLRWMKP
jgi:hypothetical protein